MMPVATNIKQGRKQKRDKSKTTNLEGFTAAMNVYYQKIYGLTASTL
jgi:hypothetical protein